MRQLQENNFASQVFSVACSLSNVDGNLISFAGFFPQYELNVVWKKSFIMGVMSILLDQISIGFETIHTQSL